MFDAGDCLHLTWAWASCLCQISGHYRQLHGVGWGGKREALMSVTLRAVGYFLFGIPTFFIILRAID